MPDCPYEFWAQATEPEQIQRWQTVFGSNRVRILSPVPHLASLPGGLYEAVYLLDLAALTPEQLGALVQRIEVMFGGTRAEILARGVPLLAKDVIVHAIPRPRQPAKGLADPCFN